MRWQRLCAVVLPLIMLSCFIHGHCAFQVQQTDFFYSNLQKRDRSGRVDAMDIFRRLLIRYQHHLELTPEQELFLDRLFQIFDMNENNRIEKDEFRATLFLLGVIQGQGPYQAT